MITRDECSGLSALLGQLIAMREGGWQGPHPEVDRCPWCGGVVALSKPGDLFSRWSCEDAVDCGWVGWPGNYDLADAARRSREAIDFLLAEIKRLEAPPPSAACGHCGARADRACKRAVGLPCLTRAC